MGAEEDPLAVLGVPRRELFDEPLPVEVGLISASSKAISTRGSGVSPRFRIPPTHVSSPASRTASIVRMRPS